MLKEFIRANKIFNLFAPFLPEDGASIITAESYPLMLLSQSGEQTNVLDLGCGAGNSIDLFKKISPGINWFGVDVEGSPELKNRTRSDGEVKIYDGVHLPYDDNSFHLIYSSQVLEHVRHPDRLMKDIFRVLKPNGYFTGSVAYLEPYHSYSIFNFTPYGLITVLQEAGFTVLELRPETDGIAMILRQMINAPRFLNRIFMRFSPFGFFVDFVGALFGLEKKERSFLKLQFSGHIYFLAKK